mgnify:CR=1 FL=1
MTKEKSVKRKNSKKATVKNFKEKRDAKAAISKEKYNESSF